MSPMPTVSESQRVARNASALILASVISKGLLFGWQIMLAPWLGTVGYGIYNTVGALLIIAASVTSFSMSLIVIRDVARRPQDAGRYASAMLFAQTLLGVLAYGGMSLAALLAGYSEAIRAYTALAGISLFFDLGGNIAYDLLIARERMTITALADVVHILARIGLAGWWLAAGYGLMGVYLATIITGAGRAILLWWLNARDGVWPLWPLDRPLLGQLLLNSAPLAAAAILSQVYQHTDKLMTTALLSEAQTAYLGTAFVIHFGIIEVFSTTILVAVYPLMARYYTVDDGRPFRWMVEKIFLYMVLIGAPLALALSIYADEVTVWLFKDGYAPTAGVLSILVWYTALSMAGNVFSKALLIQNRQRLLFRIRLGGLAANIALNTLFLLSWRDPRGAAIASVIAEALVLSAFVWDFRRSGWDWGHYGAAVLRLAGVAAVVGVVWWGLRPLGLWAGLPLGGLVFVGCALYSGILRADDWDLLYRLLVSMPFGPTIQRYWKRNLRVGQGES